MLQKIRRTNLRNSSQGQVIVLMGVFIAISVIAVASLSAEVANVNVHMTNIRSMTLSTEFSNIKESFGVALNYQIATISISKFTSYSYYYCSIDDALVKNAFDTTKSLFTGFELKHNIIFDATYTDYWFAYSALEGDVYYIDVTLYISDGITEIQQQTTYSIVCQPQIGV
jgi:hypothetical protein